MFRISLEKLENFLGFRSKSFSKVFSDKFANQGIQAKFQTAVFSCCTMIPVFLFQVSEYSISVETKNRNRKTGIIVQQENTAVWIPWITRYSGFSLVFQYFEISIFLGKFSNVMSQNSTIYNNHLSKSLSGT